MTREERIDSFDSMIESHMKMAELMTKAFKPPTDADLIRHLKGLSDMEVEGFYRYGSPKGKKLAKIECLNRGIIQKSLLQRAKEYIQKLKK